MYFLFFNIGTDKENCSENMCSQNICSHTEKCMIRIDLDMFLLQMREAADERANAVDNKLTEMAAAQCQIREQIAELCAAVASGNGGKSAEETGQAMDQVRSEILGPVSKKKKKKMAKKQAQQVGIFRCIHFFLAFPHRFFKWVEFF